MTLSGEQERAARNHGVVEHYQIGCLDVLAIEATGRPPLKIRQMVGPDGRIDLGEYGKPRVEGHSPIEVAALLSGELGINQGAVHVRVAAYRSQQLFVFGPGAGWQRSVPYQGQETVLDALQRVGSLASNAEPADVYVVRPHIADGSRPEVFHVNLHAIIVKHDPKTNLRLLPNDQIYIAPSRQARIEQVLPPWIRPAYQAIWKSPPQK
jgi:protein involved in polysaccharide export with SLBB domain